MPPSCFTICDVFFSLLWNVFCFRDVAIKFPSRETAHHSPSKPNVTAPQSSGGSLGLKDVDVWARLEFVKKWRFWKSNNPPCLCSRPICLHTLKRRRRLWYNEGTTRSRRALLIRSLILLGRPHKENKTLPNYEGQHHLYGELKRKNQREREQKWMFKV